MDEHLHSTIKRRLAQKISVNPHESKKDFESKILDAIEYQEEIKEEQVIHELENLYGQGTVTTGLQQILEAQNRFLVRKLVIQEDFSSKGYLCPEKHYLSLKKGKCTTCGRKLIAVENIIDELAEIARLHDVDLEVVQKKKDQMKQFRNIAAITYPI